MQGKYFVYVFNSDARDEMLRAGFRLLESDTSQNIYVFENRDELKFSFPDVSYITSDTLRL